MKSVAVITPGRIRSGRDGDAFVRYRADTSKLTYEPAVRQMIIEHDRVTVSVVLANSAKAAPNRRNAIGPQD